MTTGFRAAVHAAALSLALFLGTSLAAAAPAHADAVVSWQNLTTHAIEQAKEAEPQHWRSPANSRAHAQVALAMFEAANAVDRRYHSYLGVPAAADASEEAAVVTAAHEVLAALFPAQRKAFDDALAVGLAHVPAGAARTAGIELGKRTAAAAMKRSALPAHPHLVPYRTRALPGVYVDPGLPSIQPFDLAMPPYFLKSASELRSPPPPALTSERYARDIEEVRRLGGRHSTERPAEKTLLAYPWLMIDFGAIIADVARRPGRSLVQNARLYALAEMTAEDTWLAVIDGKMHYVAWRPITAIRNADLDDNPGTVREAGWEPLLPTPKHPDYPCGHCGSAAAYATILAHETGPVPPGGIRLHSLDENPGMAVTLPTWDAFVHEMSMSRIYAGAHTRYANEAAEAIGREVGRRALAGYMQPL